VAFGAAPCREASFFYGCYSSSRGTSSTPWRESSPALPPSGLIPSGGAGARNWSFLGCGGEDRGPDCVFSFSFRLLLGKIEALSIVIYLARGLNATLYLPFD
jgi:hypothetical protein